MSYKKRLLLVVCMVLIVGILWCSGIEKYFDFQLIKDHADELRQLVHEQYARSVFFYIAIYTGAIALFLPVGVLLTLVGGFLFGTVAGAVYANIGATLGSIIAFLIVRYLIGDFLQERYHAKLVKFNHSMHTYGAWYLLVIHLVAIIPFALVNLLTGLTRVSLWTFIWTTSLGILPGTLIYAFAGQQLTTINTLRDVLSLKNVFWLLVTLKVAALTPLILSKINEYYRRWKQQHKN